MLWSLLTLFWIFHIHCLHAHSNALKFWFLNYQAVSSLRNFALAVLFIQKTLFFFKQTNKQTGYQFSLTRFLIIIFGHNTHMRNIPDPGPMQWKPGVLNTGPPGKFLPRTLFQVFYLFKSWFRYHFSEKLLLVLPCRPVLLGIIYPVFLFLFLFLTMLITLWRGPICFYPFISWVY